MSDKLKNKRKICFVSPFAYGLFNPEADLKFGGAEVQMYLISKELSLDESFDISFIVLDLGQEKKEIYGNVKVFKSYERGRSILNLIKAPIQLILILKKISPDVIINRAHGVEAGICAIYARLFNKKFIYSLAHDDDANGKNFEGLRGKIFKFGFKRADKLIAQSEDQVDLLKRRYYKEAVLIKNSFSIKENKKEKDLIFWVGSSADKKRPGSFLDLAEANPKEKFVMVVTKSKVNLDLWHEIKEKTKKIENLKFIEMIPFNEIDDFFARTKIFVNTSTSEGFPNVFLQAMIAKAPILSLKVDPDDFIKNYKCGVVCDDNSEIFKNKFMELIENEDDIEEMGQNGFDYIQKNHNIKKNIEKWKKQI